MKIKDNNSLFPKVCCYGAIAALTLAVLLSVVPKSALETQESSSSILSIEFVSDSFFAITIILTIALWFWGLLVVIEKRRKRGILLTGILVLGMLVFNWLAAFVVYLENVQITSAVGEHEGD